MSDASQSGGVYAWMTSVRDSMDNDSSRKIFESQVQSHAFVFLDNYLEQILVGPKQGPIIELVKTPGRRKNVPRRTRSTAVAAPSIKSTTFFSSNDDNSEKGVIPVNSFHKALLQAKERDISDRKSPTISRSTPEISTEKIYEQATVSVRVVNVPEITVSIAPESRTDPIILHPQHYPRALSSESSMPFLTSNHVAGLSVITEGDESAESHTNGLSEAISNKDESPNETRHSVYSQANICHSSDIPTGNHTEPLLSRTIVYSPNTHERNAITVPLPVVPKSNAVPIPPNDSSPKMLLHKNSAVGFPTLPAPSPLRRSMHITQDIPSVSVLPTIVPASMPLGKRTSWLMKAREAKAMEGAGSFYLPLVAAESTTPFPQAPTAVKRKSDEMLDIPPNLDLDEDQHKSKITRSAESGTVLPNGAKKCEPPLLQGEPIVMSPVAMEISLDHTSSCETGDDGRNTQPTSTEQGSIDLFKRTVEELGARTGKSKGKSLGGAAVVALAEARAAAEARIAERNKVNSESSGPQTPSDGGLFDQEFPGTRAQLQHKTALSNTTESRLSLSDLVADTTQPDRLELSTKTLYAVDPRIDNGDEYVSTSPPHSPPSKNGNSGFVRLAGPVFNKPLQGPVFMPPVTKQTSNISECVKEFSANQSNQFTLPAAMSLGIPARLATPPDAFSSFVPGTSKMVIQLSQSSVYSDQIPGKRNGVLISAASTDDLHDIDLRPCDSQSVLSVAMDDDDDDSWPLEEKLAAAEPGWRPFDFSNVDKEDTWSSLPTESQGSTRNLMADMHIDAVPPFNDSCIEVRLENERVGREQETIEVRDIDRSILDTGESQEVGENEMANPGDIDAELIIRTTSQASMTSTTSSTQSQAGFFSQATKLVNTMLGGGKKAKPELKSLQLAAAAAKKQQEEADKKVQRIKEMEARRQVIIAKKAEEEKVRLLEDGKKSKDELEKRKREREENTDRRPLKPPVSTKKADEDATKKRKLIPETERKQEGRKPPSKDKKDIPPPKLVVTPATKIAAIKGTKVTTPALVSSTAYNATQNPMPTKSFVPEAKPFKVVPSSKGKAKAKPQEEDMNDKLPSTVVQSQMAARAKAQMQAAKVPTAEVPSESIELPEINSEYSDSEDEDRVRTFDPPDWAQSPELRQALQMQSTVNPDDIFGAIRPLRMEEIFRTRQSRFRARTSSANWAGSDRLTIEEIREYERRMGFQQSQVE